MSRQLTELRTDSKELKIQENIAKWQATEEPLAPLTDEQLDLIYELGDIIAANYDKPETDSQLLTETSHDSTEDESTSIVPKVIWTMQDFIKWTVNVEQDIKHENLKKYQNYYEVLCDYQSECEKLFDHSNDTLTSLNELKKEYENVTEKTNYLHDLSEQVMNNQKKLKDTKKALSTKLSFFTNFHKYQEKIEHLNNKINTAESLDILDKIDESVNYLNSHLQYKESRIYKMKYESLLANILNKIYDYVNHILIETTKQVVDPDSKAPGKAQSLPQAPNALVDSAFSLYYGKFQSASSKVKLILSGLEEREEHNEHYKNLLLDCQKSYLTQRLPILSVAVSKALMELKEKHKTDYSILFRSCSLFTMKVCQDEAMCYNYFFSRVSDLFNDYLGSLCQNLYDTLRPSLISINYIEVLSELCGILKVEMLSDKVVENESLIRYVQAIRQLLQDVEERLVFRTNIFFQHDLLGYKPSPGDLAYPEKLEQMENVAVELRDRRSDSRSSVVSIESHEVAQINTPQVTHFRSYTDNSPMEVPEIYVNKPNFIDELKMCIVQEFNRITLTILQANHENFEQPLQSIVGGNSPTDLHGMWYPTVKRTLVCLSRLYFCLDRGTFQGLAQEALVICIKTVQSAADLISKRKTPIDGQLFQIKHLLIIREQIAPFQVDFTTKEMSLDFSAVQKAAIDLINHRRNIFSFSSNNALLEFLLEGTPKVKEYLIDSRKEIDKQLKHSCEAFISHATELLLGNLSQWIQKSEHILKIIQAENIAMQDLTVAKQDFGKANTVAQLVKEAQQNMKKKIPEVQRSLQLYLANRETEFILFRPIKNNMINVFMQVDQILAKGGYSSEDQLLIACPSPEQVNILICSVSLAINQDVKQNVT